MTEVRFSLWKNDYYQMKSIQKQPLKITKLKGVLRNFVKFTGKHLRQSLFFNKLTGLGNIIFTEHLRTTASEFYQVMHFKIYQKFDWKLRIIQNK